MLSDTSWKLASEHRRTSPSEYRICFASSLPASDLSVWRHRVSYYRAAIWYKRAAEHGDKRAIQRLRGNPNQPVHHTGGPGSVLRRDVAGDGSGKGKDRDCVIM